MFNLIPQGASGDIVEINMNRPPVNAQSPDMVAGLRQTLRDVVGQGARATVLSGREGLYSAGLDVAALIQLDRPAMEDFLTDYYALWNDLASCAIPIAAAITGHAPAGGAAVASFCDYRVMAQGKFRMGLNEVAVGLVMPRPICFVTQYILGHHRAERVLVEAQMLNPDELLEIGWVDEVVEPDQVVPSAVAWCEKLLKLPPKTLNATRHHARSKISAAITEDVYGPRETADSWFSEEGQSTIKALLDKLAAKQG